MPNNQSVEIIRQTTDDFPYFECGKQIFWTRKKEFVKTTREEMFVSRMSGKRKQIAACRTLINCWWNAVVDIHVNKFPMEYSTKLMPSQSIGRVRVIRAYLNLIQLACVDAWRPIIMLNWKLFDFAIVRLLLSWCLRMRATDQHPNSIKWKKNTTIPKQMHNKPKRSMLKAQKNYNLHHNAQQRGKFKFSFNV